MKIRDYQSSDFLKIIDTMCEAFREDILYTYFIEDGSKRLRFLKKFMKFRLKFGLKKGKVFVSDDGKGVIILIAPNEVMSMKELVCYGGMAAMLRCNKLQRNRIMEFNAFADAQTQKNIKQPYWHISPVCVSTQAQGNGYGSALIKHALQYINAECPCYLETQNPKNGLFYKKFGFRELSEAPLPGTGIRNFSMVYDAH